MRTFLVTLLIGASLGATVNAQGPTVMLKPAKYNEQPDGDLEEEKAKSSKNLWLVFSDRDSNKAFASPSAGALVVSTVSFMDKFYVTGESGDFLELYKWKDELDSKMGSTKGTTRLNPGKAERVGWINKQNLLLWSKCLVNKQTRIEEKALNVITLNNLDKYIGHSNTVKIYPSPNGDGGKSISFSVFNILYVYKRSGARVMIGKKNKTHQYNAEMDILGWMDTAFLQLWSGKVCIAPNNDADAVKVRIEANVKASLFYSENDALAWKEGKAVQPIWDNDSYEKLWLPSQFRYPVFDLKEINGNILIKTGFFTSVLTNDSVSRVSVNPMVKNYLKRLGSTVIDADLINNSKGLNVQFFVPAWTTQNTNRLQPGKSVFQYVIFLHEEELFELINNLNWPGSVDQSTLMLRNKLYETYESLAQSYFGEEISKDKKFVRKITISQIFERITGVPSNFPQLKNIQLTDIKDKDKVSEVEILEIVTNIRKSYEYLRSAKNDPESKFRYATEDGVFYWIPQDYLP